jgi:phage gp29-like protein
MGFWGKVFGTETIAAKIDTDIQKLAPPIPEGLLPELPENDPLANIGTTSTKVQVELPTLGIGKWSQPAQVLAALEAHDIGNFRSSGLLMQALLTDPAIRGPLDVRCKALTGLPVVFKPADDSEEAKECAEYVTAHWREWLTCEEQERFMRTRLLMGASLAQAIWTTSKDKKMVPEVNCWEPTWIFWYWDGQHRNFGRWQVITSNGTVEPVSGDRNWIWALNTIKDPQYTGLIRSLALRFIARQQALQGLGKYQQRYALAILKLKQPSTFDEADVANIQSQLQVDASPVVTLPQGDTPEASWDLEWESIESSSGWQVFIETLSTMKAEMAIDILGQTLTSDTGAKGGGSKAQASVHDQVRLDLRTSDAVQDASIWRDQLLKPFAALNYGDPELAPLMEYEVAPPTDLSAKADSLLKLSQALQTFDNPNIDAEAILMEFGVPLKNMKDAQ